MQGLEKWRKVLDAYPKLLEDTNLTDELANSIQRYRSVLDQLDQEFPQPFILQDVLDAYYRTSADAPLQVEGSRDKAEAEAADPTKSATP